MMMQELRPTAAVVDDLAPAGASDCQLAAVYSLAFNVGTGNVRGSKLVQKWHAGDLAGAAHEFLDFDLVGGHPDHRLDSRRKIESQVFLGISPAI